MAKKKDTTVDIAFQLKAIELLDGQLNFEQPMPENVNTFNFDIRIENKIDSDKSLIIAINSVSISREKKICGYIKVSCVFHVENFSAFEQDPSTGKQKIPNDFITTVNSISISTTRGVMFGYFRGTQLHHAFLPIIVPTQLKEEVPSE